MEKRTNQVTHFRPTTFQVGEVVGLLDVHGHSELVVPGRLGAGQNGVPSLDVLPNNLQVLVWAG
eukprot:9480206-Alexandrium_andersonii.AAC.1